MQQNDASDLKIFCDVVIAGCGVAGLYTALNLPSSLNVVMLSKGSLDECDSMLAQGGISVLRDESDYATYLEDTMRAGHYENSFDSVDVMIRSSRRIIDDLIYRGVCFETDKNGKLVYTREGAHSIPRICFYKDVTGKEITTVLLEQVRALPHVRILENTTMLDIIESPACLGSFGTSSDTSLSTSLSADPNDPNNPKSNCDAVCDGIVAENPLGEKLSIIAKSTVLATGGIGGLYEHSTNYPLLKGDACRIAREHGVALKDMDYVQIHPTSLYTGRPGRSFLISESCRGEGAVLLNSSGERFCDELQARDLVTKAIFDEMDREGSEHVWLSFEKIDTKIILSHFPHIYEECLKEGYDITKEAIPVVPAQHYFMGGIAVDLDGRTTMDRLYAVGETSCTGVHGRNRLASNSLLEALVFSKRAAYTISTGKSLPVDACDACDGSEDRALASKQVYSQ